MQPQFTSAEERKIYNSGYKAGYNEGMRKAIMLLQLVACNTESFTEGILQNSPEANELRKLMTDTKKEI